MLEERKDKNRNKALDNNWLDHYYLNYKINMRQCESLRIQTTKLIIVSIWKVKIALNIWLAISIGIIPRNHRIQSLLYIHRIPCNNNSWNIQSINNNLINYMNQIVHSNSCIKIKSQRINCRTYIIKCNRI